jgi:hypothetical protein
MSLPDFARVLNTFDRVQPALLRWLPAGDATELGQRLHGKAASMQPRIMVYGIYNAGKSTLINALMGRDEAEVADRPKTFRVTPYPWHGFTLLDTPGIDAPVRHEEETRAELERCDVVLFVVAIGGAIDEARTWQELVDIVRRGRRVMLIINNKQGLEPGSVEFLQVADTLRQHLQQAAEAAGLTDVLKQVPIHLTNARSALRGRLENKPALVARSGILALESELAEFLRNSDSHAVFDTCRSDLLRAVDAADSALHLKAGNATSQALAKLGQRIEHERARLACALDEQLDQLLPDARRKMGATIRQAVQGGDGAPEKMEAAAIDIAVTVGARLNATLALEVASTQRNLRDIGDVLASELAIANASLHVPAGEGPAAGGASVFEQTFKQVFQKMPIGKLTEQGALAALKFGKDQLPLLFKGIGAKTMGRWAGMAGKWAGPVVQIGIFLWELYQAGQQEQAQKQELARQSQAIEDAVSEFIGNLRDGYRRMIAELVDQVFLPLEDWLATEEAAANSQQATGEADRILFAQARIALRNDQ